MNYIEYGKENTNVIVLLHGGGLSWWNYREVAENLSSSYRVILPILDGHAKSGCDFTSIEESAEKIIAFIDEQFGGHVLLIGGLSLGGQIALEILTQRKDICQFALIESALVIPSKLTYAMIKPTFGSCYGLIKHRWFAKLQFKSLRIKQELFEDYFVDTCAISKKSMIAFLEANALYQIKPALAECLATTYIFVGEKENSAMKKSAKIISEILPKSSLKVLPNMYHGEFSINNPKRYASAVLEILSDEIVEFYKKKILDYLDKGLIKENYHTVSSPNEIFELYRKSDIDKFMESYNVTRLHFVGVDMLSYISDDRLDLLNDREFEEYMKFLSTLCEREDCVGMSIHLLDVFKKNKG